MNRSFSIRYLKDLVDQYKRPGMDDRAVNLRIIDQLETDMHGFIMGVKVNNGNLVISAYIPINGSGSYDTQTYVIPDYKRHDTARRLGITVCELVDSRQRGILIDRTPISRETPLFHVHQAMSPSSVQLAGKTRKLLENIL